LIKYTHDVRQDYYKYYKTVIPNLIGNLPYKKGDSRNLINRILNVTLDLIGGGNDSMNDSRSLINHILNITLDLIGDGNDI